MKATDVVESEIITLVKQSEERCPICRVVDKAVSGWLDGALSDLLHNEEARAKLNNGGLCRKHSEVFVEVVKSNSSIGPLSASIMLSEILRNQLIAIKAKEKRSRLERLRAPGKKTEGCYLCRIALETEYRFVNGFRVFFSRPEVKHSYERSETIICFDHTTQLLEMPTDVSEWFVSVQRSKISALLDEMDLLISKHDYRSKESIGKESSSWVRAIQTIGELSRH